METFIDRLHDELKTDEGCKYVTYLDHLGLLTGGIGHLIKGTDEEFNKPIGTSIAGNRVMEWFEQDIKITIDDCRKVYDDWDYMNEEVRLICCNMMFNLGYPRYSKFKKMIQAVKDGDHLEAGNQMKDSRWHKQVTNRADRLISRMRAVGLS
jgi:lysozyme